MHERSTKARSIVAGLNCSVKPLFKVVTGALNLICNQIENCNLKTQNTCWLFQIIQTAIDTINKVNSRNSAILISTFDFSSLYINIPHHKLKSMIEELINVCFNGRNEICIGFGATWTNNQQKYRLSNNRKCRFSFNEISLK